jgi:hypothetical protein
LRDTSYSLNGRLEGNKWYRTGQPAAATRGEEVWERAENLTLTDEIFQINEISQSFSLES